MINKNKIDFNNKIIIINMKKHNNKVKEEIYNIYKINNMIIIILINNLIDNKININKFNKNHNTK